MSAAAIETAWAALLDRLRAKLPDIATISRQPADWTPEQMPAVELWDNGREEPIGQESPLFYGWRVNGEIVIHARANLNLDRDRSPFSDLNELIGSVRAALASSPDDLPRSGAYWTDLGGAVENFACGSVEKGGGAVTGAVSARIPVSFDVPE